MRQSTTLSLRGAKRRGNPAALFNMPLADAFLIRWIATACGLAMTTARHCEEKSDAAIQSPLFNTPLADAFLIRWIATACGLAMTAHMGRSAANEGEKFHV